MKKITFEKIWPCDVESSEGWKDGETDALEQKSNRRKEKGPSSVKKAAIFLCTQHDGSPGCNNTLYEKE